MRIKAAFKDPLASDCWWIISLCWILVAVSCMKPRRLAEKWWQCSCNDHLNVAEKEQPRRRIPKARKWEAGLLLCRFPCFWSAFRRCRENFLERIQNRETLTWINLYILRLLKGPGRTHNRIRSPRFLEFGRWSKVGNRKRQNRSRDLFCRLLFPSSLHRPNSRNLGGNPLLWEKDWLWGLGTGVLVLMFELSRGYLTSLVESGFLHGADCWTWNVFRDAPCGANSHLRTGEDGGFSCWQSPRCLHPLHLNGLQHIMRCDLGATGWHPWGRRVDWRMQSMKAEIVVGTPLTKKLDEQRIECETVSFCLTDFSAKRLKAFVAAKVTPCNSLIVGSLESTCLIQKNVNHFIWWICLMFVRDLTSQWNPGLPWPFVPSIHSHSVFRIWDHIFTSAQLTWN